jgi:hypothetical protein
VPPIYQPEVAADDIVFASTARMREVWVGASSFKAILANKIAPWLLDRYLARFGYHSQISAEPASKDAPDNLFKPIEGDFGAHGRFDAQAIPIRGPAIACRARLVLDRRRDNWASLSSPDRLEEQKGFSPTVPQHTAFSIAAVNV